MAPPSLNPRGAAISTTRQRSRAHGTCRAPSAGVGHTRSARLKHGSRCHFSFPTAKSSSSPRSRGPSLTWEQPSAVVSSKQVEVGLCEVDGDFYECERDGRRSLPRSSADGRFKQRCGGGQLTLSRSLPQVSVAPALRTPCATTPERGLRAREGRALTDASERSTEVKPGSGYYRLHSQYTLL